MRLFAALLAVFWSIAPAVADDTRKTSDPAVDFLDAEVMEPFAAVISIDDGNQVFRYSVFFLDQFAVEFSSSKSRGVAVLYDLQARLWIDADTMRTVTAENCETWLKAARTSSQAAISKDRDTDASRFTGRMLEPQFEITTEGKQLRFSNPSIAYELSEPLSLPRIRRRRLFAFERLTEFRSSMRRRNLLVIPRLEMLHELDRRGYVPGRTTLRIQFPGSQRQLQTTVEIHSLDQAQIDLTRQLVESITAEAERKAEAIRADQRPAGELTSFSDARSHALAILERAVAASKLVQRMSEEIEEAQSDAERQQLRAYRTLGSRQLSDMRKSALTYLMRALELQTADTPVAELNDVRLQAARIHITRGAFQAAFDIVEPVFEQPESTPSAADCVYAALTARYSLFRVAPREDRRHRLAELGTFSRLCFDRWPLSLAALAHVRMLGSELRAFERGSTDLLSEASRVTTWASRLPAELEHRHTAVELSASFGWTAYRLLRLREEEGERIDSNLLARLRAAVEPLVDEASHNVTSEDDPSARAGVDLIRAEMHLLDGNYAQAWATLLDSSPDLVEVLLDRKEGIDSRRRTVQSIFNVATWAGIQLIASQPDDEALRDSVIARIGSLLDARTWLQVEAFRIAAAIQATETSIRNQILKIESQANRRSLTRAGLAVFRCVAETSNDLMVISDALSAVVRIGQDIKPSDEEMTLELYSSANQIYSRTRESLEKDNRQLPVSYELTTLRAHHARLLGRLKRHREAVDVWLLILAEGEHNADQYQSEATMALGAWGMSFPHEDSNRKTYLKYAREGFRHDGQFVIWGWRILTRRLRSEASHAEGTERRELLNQMHSAQVSLAWNLLIASEFEDDPVDFLHEARQGFLQNRSLDPHLGGEFYKRGYKTVYRHIIEDLAFEYDELPTVAD